MTQQCKRRKVASKKMSDMMISVMFSEFFLPNLLSYLTMKDIVHMDTSICNKSIREMWLKLIANDIGSVSTKIQPYFTHDRPIKWCSIRNFQFQCLDLDCGATLKGFLFEGCKQVNITPHGAMLLASCCTNLVDFKLCESFWHQIGTDRILIELAQRCGKLKRFSLNRTRKFDERITPIMTSNPNLEEIEFRDCDMSTDIILTAISINCHKLKKVDIRNMPLITDKGLMALLSNNHDLVEICLAHCPLLTDASLIAMSTNCHKLHKMSFLCMANGTEMSQAMPHFTDQGMAALVSTNHDLEEIHLDLRRFTVISLIAITQHCHKLKKVIIYGTEHILNINGGMIALVSNNRDLEEISIYGCKELTDGSLVALATHCHKLRKIDVENAELITDNAITALVFTNHDLEDIKLHNCNLLTDVSFLLIADYCHKLKKVDIRNMPLITDEGLMALLSNNHDLVEICLARCPLLTDASLVAVATHCNKLKKISFNQMYRFTDRSLNALLSANHSVYDIHFSDCTEFTDASLTAIANNCPNLKKLACSGRNKMSLLCQKNFYKRLPKAVLVWW